MRIADVQTKEIGTVAKREPLTTAGLTSGYQRTNITPLGVSVAETTAGWMLVGLINLPRYEPLPFGEPYVEVRAGSLTPGHRELAQGYQAMAAENSLLAEEFLPVALETWPAWEELYEPNSAVLNKVRVK